MNRIVSGAVVAALGLAACGGSGGVAATVNGADIAVNDIEGMVFSAEDGVSAEIAAQYLGFLVQWTAIEQAAETDFGIMPGDAAIDSQLQRLVASFGQGATIAEFLEAQNVSESGLRRFAAQLVIQEAVRGQVTPTVDEPTEEAAQQSLDDQVAAWTEVCASHILVATEAEANAVLDRLQNGEDFAVVAQEVSLDSVSAAAGGDLGCDSPENYVAEFADATLTADIGEVTGPVSTTFGFHLVLVGSRVSTPVEEVRRILHDQAITDAVNAWFLDAVVAADVVVDEQYGTWVTDPVPQVVLAS